MVFDEPNAVDAVDVVRRLHEHRRWVNDQLREVAGKLTESQLRQRFEMGMGSVWGTLVHLYGAEHTWLEALTGGATVAVPCDDSFETLEQLLIAWGALERRWDRYLNALTPRKLAGPVTRKGISTPAGDVLLHVALHAHHHTAQLINMLRHLGVASAKLPDGMMITLSRRQHRG